MADPGLLTALSDRILSETGLIGGLLFGALVYVARQWGNEREAHSKTIERLWDISEKSVLNAQAATEASRTTKETVERLIAGLSNHGGRS